MDTTSLKLAMRKVSGEESPIIINTPRFGWDNPKYEALEQPVRQVMTSYQNANRWLDTLKEIVLMDYHCPYFSHILHELAHRMPSYFDTFGEILHKENLSVPYPSTEEWSKPVPDIQAVISTVYDILDDIKSSLINFKKIAESIELYALSIECDSLLLSISNEYSFFYHIESMIDTCRSNMCLWDSKIYEYYKNYEFLE